MPTWKIDPAHTVVEFTVKHMMVSSVSGRFRRFSGTVEFDEADPASSSVHARIEADSIDTGADKRDAHLRSADFLDVAVYPELEFRSTKVDVDGAGRGTVHGDLTIHGATRKVELEATVLGTFPGMPGQPQRVAFDATTKINRKDWGLNWNQTLEAGGFLVGDHVTIHLMVEAEVST